MEGGWVLAILVFEVDHSVNLNSPAHHFGTFLSCRWMGSVQSTDPVFPKELVQDQS